MRTYDVHFLPGLVQDAVAVTCDSVTVDSGFFMFFDGRLLLGAFRCDQVLGITSNKAAQ